VCEFVNINMHSCIRNAQINENKYNDLIQNNTGPVRSIEGAFIIYEWRHGNMLADRVYSGGYRI